MSEPFIGQIMMTAFDFAPKGWSLCNGQVIPISQNTALFSILGTTFGGNGQQTFGLPNFQGRAPVGMGTGPGLAPVSWGEVAGVEAVTLQQTEMPGHTHSVAASQGIECSKAAGDSASPAGRFPAITSRPLYAESATGNLAGGQAAPTGGGQPHPNMQPYLVVSYVIALTGIFPSRN